MDDFISNVRQRLIDSMSPELRIAYMLNVEFVYEHTMHDNGSLTISMRPKHKLSFEYDANGEVSRVIVYHEENN